ncbi:MAG TPA: hypothetical protein VE777_05045 [Gaiellales bacterium]|nr:hypothetical protein [Gaiellales bacterium]
MNVRMIRAELLRLQRSRGVVAWSVLLSVGAVAAMFLAVLGVHLNDPSHYGPSGGADNLRHALGVLAVVGGVGAAIAGASAGTADLSSGVFRDLVVTGVSRLALFRARVPGLLLFWVPIMLAAYAVAIGFTFGLANGLPTPTATDVVKDGLWLMSVTTVTALVSLGVSSVIGSRGISIGVLLGWQLAATPLLMAAGPLGPAREALLSAAADRLQPFRGDSGVAMAYGTALVVMAAWAVIPLLAGGWRTRTRES